MATRPKNKMSMEHRAKQFMPFSALTGLDVALAARERIRVPKSELSEDRAELLDQIFRTLTPGKMVTVTYFYKDEYLKTTGLIGKIDNDARILQVVTTKIPFDDIYDITD